MVDGANSVPQTEFTSVADLMERYTYPFPQRVKLSVKRWIDDLLEFCRSPLRRPEVLLITGNASPAKVSDIEARLRFIFACVEKCPKIRTASRGSIFDYLRESGVAIADAAAVPAFARRLRWVADLDYEKNPSDGWDLIDFGSTISRGNSEKSIEASRRVFVDHVQKLKSQGPRPVYIFGTGPSLSLARDRSFNDGIVVVCNTIVRDADLWHHLKPSFLVGGDPIYHLGSNPYARAFRSDALRRLQESEGKTLFVYPARGDSVIRREFRDVESLLVPVPWGGHTDITVDLTKRFCLPASGNVLNVVLLPLGCTLGTHLRLWGFDGRAPDDSGFWANSDRHSYPELMQSIRDAHPAFFAAMTPAGNEIKYVNEVHGDWLDARLSEAEGRGFSFQMLHPSWTPTLQKRYREPGSESVG